MADQSAAPDQAHRARRGRQRPVVLRLHLPARGAAAALRAGGPAATQADGARAEIGVVPADGQLDRRRSRRQPVRDGGGDARHAARCRASRVLRYLSRGTARAWRRAVARRRISPISPTDLRALAERSPDTSPHRQGEPYRLAVSGIYARLAATAARLDMSTRTGRRSARPRLMPTRPSSRPISICFIAR